MDLLAHEVVRMREFGALLLRDRDGPIAQTLCEIREVTELFHILLLRLSSNCT